MPGIDFEAILQDYPGDDGDVESPWYLYVGVILESTGEISHITELWSFLKHHFPAEDAQLRAARRLREALLKTSVLVGFPRGINALAALRSAINDQNPELGKMLESDQSMRANLTADQLNKRGYDFFASVYGKVADKVHDNMALSSGGDLPHFAILSVYGELMAETSIVDAKQTGLLEFVAGICGVLCHRHMYGSRNLGNSKEEIQASVRLVRSTMSAVGLSFDDGKMTFVEKMDTW